MPTAKTIRDAFDASWNGKLYNDFTIDMSVVKSKGVYVVEQIYDAKHWALSYDIWGTTVYADLLLLYNNIMAPYDLHVGREIKIPDVNTFSAAIKELNSPVFAKALKMQKTQQKQFVKNKMTIVRGNGFVKFK